MSLATWIVMGLSVVALVLVLLARRGRPSELGSVSRTWIIENKVDHHDRG
jgi:hypothetical protein